MNDDGFIDYCAALFDENGSSVIINAIVSSNHSIKTDVYLLPSYHQLHLIKQGVKFGVMLKSEHRRHLSVPIRWHNSWGQDITYGVAVDGQPVGNLTNEDNSLIGMEKLELWGLM